MRIGAGLGDDRAAIAVADEHGRTGLAVEDAVGGGDVIRQRSLRFLDDADAVAVLAEDIGDAPPARTVGEGAVDEDDVLDRLGPRRRDGRRQKRHRCGRSGNGFIRHRALLHDQTSSTYRLNKSST